MGKPMLSMELFASSVDILLNPVLYFDLIFCMILVISPQVVFAFNHYN